METPAGTPQKKEASRWRVEFLFLRGGGWPAVSWSSGVVLPKIENTAEENTTMIVSDG